MADIPRLLLVGSTFGFIVVGSFVAPQVIGAVMAEPAQAAVDGTVDTLTKLFPPPFDASKLTKYDISFADNISTDIQRTDTIKKIGFGKKSIVTIVTTPSGTYSSDALTSPNVRYPGIDVAPKAVAEIPPQFGTVTSPRGTWFWNSFTVGSITYYSSTFKPTR